MHWSGTHLVPATCQPGPGGSSYSCGPASLYGIKEGPGPQRRESRRGAHPDQSGRKAQHQAPKTDAFPRRSPPAPPAPPRSLGPAQRGGNHKQWRASIIHTGKGGKGTPVALLELLAELPTSPQHAGRPGDQHSPGICAASRSTLLHALGAEPAGASIRCVERRHKASTAQGAHRT